MFTRTIFPLTLRQRVSSRVQKLFQNVNENDVSLALDKKLRLDLSKSDVAHRGIIFNGFYELDLSRNIVRLARAGGILVDVGANYGYFSCLWASQNSDNRVFAFEASPSNVGPLQNNVEKNVLGDRIVVIPRALGKEKGK